MGRKNGSGRMPQRTRLIPNREERSRRASNAFAIMRPVSHGTTLEIHDRLRNLQLEEDIPASVKLFNHDMHSSIIQERRVRKGLAKGLAAGFAVGTALEHIESGLPGHGRGTIEARFTGVNVIGRNRNVLVGRIRDEVGILERARSITKKILDDMGLRMNIDNCDHLTLGVDEGQGLTETERRHVIHTTADTISDIPVMLEPVIVEHDGVRVPLSNFRIQEPEVG